LTVDSLFFSYSLQSMDLWSLLCPIALNNMASILQVPTLTIALLSDVPCGPKLAVVSSQSIMYWCWYTIFSICLTLYHHNLTNIKHLTLYPSLSLISYSRHWQWNYILMIYCNASYAHWIIRANLCCEI